jgi:imidazole glycerol-phosphate synthase subunit HisH
MALRRGSDMTSVAVLDYECGNVRSITSALTKVGAMPVLTRDPVQIQSADALIIPGVGAFANAMEALQKYDLIDPIHQFVQSGKRILGICLGMQMLFEESEEFGHSRGLGLIKGSIRRLPVKVDSKIRLPHIAWNGIYPSEDGNWEDSIFCDIQPGSKMYFVHSFAPIPDSRQNIMSQTTYGDCQFVSSVRAGRVFGCQFHPEKSRDAGLAILKQFIELSEDARYGRDVIAGTKRDGCLLRTAGSGSIL